MRGKAVIPLVLGLGVGLLAVKFGVDAIRRAQGSSEPKQTVQVVRAKVDIGAAEQITPDMVEAVETTDLKLVPANERIGSIEQLKEAGGQMRVAAKNIPMGSPVLKSMLAPEGTMPGMVGKIPPGMRAVSVKIDEITGVAYQMKPGDWVDVLVAMDIDAGGRQKETISEVILQKVQVAAIGFSGQQEASSGARARPARSATLFVAEEDVPKLHLAQTRGRITLSMRGDDKETMTTGATARMSDVMAMLGGFVAPPTPAPVMQTQTAFPPKPEVVMDPPHEIMVYRGVSSTGRNSNVERITFESSKSPHILEVSQGVPTRAARRMGVTQRTTPTPSPMPQPVESSEFNESSGDAGTYEPPTEE